MGAADRRPPRTPAPGWGLIVLLLLAWGLPRPAPAGEPPPGATPVERYPASFRQAVREALERGVARLRRLQAPGGTWGDPTDRFALGHTALPTLALLKAGVPATDPQVEKAFGAMAGLPRDQVYSVGTWLMALAALYAPAVDTGDEEVGTARESRLDPKATRARLSRAHRDAVEAGVDFLVRAQGARGLWDYGLPASAAARGFDLSNSQYALLGLRAALDCGLEVPPAVWRAALRELVAIQEPAGPEVELVEQEVRDGYVLRSRTRARARGWRYSDRRKHGPLGENTVHEHGATASMTTAGLAMVATCTEGLWRSRRFSGKDRREAAVAVRDGLAWMQQHYSVTENVPLGRPHYHYYLYGLERAGMLTGRRWIGPHDWYRDGADQWLAQEQPGGGWGDHVATAFGILFLKRATRRADTVVVTGG